MTDQESFSDKVWLLVIDKVVFGAIAGIVACLFTWYLHREQLQADYQKQMFEKRVAAYETTIAHAKILSDELLAFVAWADSDVGVSAGEILWRKRFGERQKLLESKKGPGSGGGGGSFTAPDVVLDAFQGLQLERNLNSLHFSKTIDTEIETFMETLWKEFSEAQQITERPADNSDELARRKRIQAAYDRLRSRIERSLATDKIILG
ncbi:MAG: hypothetical protein QOD99_878 [Chthoniobacter sp.]|jgi:hypothetical protein|nr:hypothetical protein [Chthoniobacter sp.]